MFRVFGKLSAKIEHVPVRVAFAQYRDEAKNVALHSKAFAVGLNQAFGSQFGSPVKRSLDGEGTRLRRGENIRLSVNRSSRRKNNAFAVSLAHGLEHVPGCDRVLIQILAWTFSAETHIGIGCEMNHQFHALHRLRQAFPVKQIGLMESEFRVRQRTFQEPDLSRRQVIEPKDTVTRGEKAVDHIAADKARRTSNQNAQK